MAGSKILSFCLKKGWSELTRQLLIAVRANISMINFERLMILLFWFQIKIEQKQDAKQLFSIKAPDLSLKQNDINLSLRCKSFFSLYW